MNIKNYQYVHTPHTHTHTLTPTRSLTHVRRDTKSSMNNEQFDTLDSSVLQYDAILTLNLNLDRPLAARDN